MNDRTVRVKVLFFASTRELVGQQSIEVGLEEGATVNDLLNRLLGFYPKLQQYAPSLMTAVNTEYVTRGAVLRHGDEVALIPPVSGGY